VPNCRAYDPCFGYELAAIVRDGARRMLEAREDVFYYVTVATRTTASRDARRGEEGILRGMYRLRDGSQVQLLGSGAILREVIAAAELLEKDWGIQAAVWSVTSFTELRRDGMRASAGGASVPKDRPGATLPPRHTGTSGRGEATM